MLIFTDSPTLQKVYTCENVDIYGWPLIVLLIGILSTLFEDTYFIATDSGH